jgi:hypothetical protein
VVDLEPECGRLLGIVNQESSAKSRCPGIALIGSVCRIGSFGSHVDERLRDRGAEGSHLELACRFRREPGERAADFVLGCRTGFAGAAGEGTDETGGDTTKQTSPRRVEG